MLKDLQALFNHPGGRTFVWFWLGQLVSMFGSAITTFALGVWLYRETGEATPIFLTAFAHYLPRLTAGLYAGVVVDRLNRQRLMVLTDIAQASLGAVMLGLYAFGMLEPWLVYLLVGLKSLASTFQEPTELAITSTLVPNEHLARAHGLNSVQFGTSNLLGPVAGGFLVIAVGLPGILLVDALSFAFGAVVTGLLRIPHTPPDPVDTQGSVLEEARTGLRFIFARPGLAGLLLTHAMFNFTLAFTARLVTPLVLARTGGDAAALGFIAAAFGVGMLAGGLVMGAWGGPKNRVHGVLIGFALAGLLEQGLMGLGQVVLVWAIANFFGGFVSSFYESAYFAIWQSKTPAQLQGRVFSGMMLVLRAIAPLAYLTAGVYADRLFQPAVQGALGTALEPLLGGGPGRGYTLMFVVAGVLSVIVGLTGYLRPGVPTLERDLPDATEPETPTPQPDPYQTLEFVWDFESPDGWDFSDDDEDTL